VRFTIFSFHILILIVTSRLIIYSFIENENNNAPTQEEIKAEVCKWVKRSSIGSAFVLTVSVAWMLVFQLNRDNFGPKWFVMPEDDEERTGW